MRKILFRAKRLDNGEWLETKSIESYPIPDGGSLVFMPDPTMRFRCYFDEKGNMVGKDFMNKGAALIAVDPETVGQYTGLDDKNGKKIFEGNIVHVRDNLTKTEFSGTVKFDNASFMIDDGLTTHYRWIDYEVEVIGDAHDNTEEV